MAQNETTPEPHGPSDPVAVLRALIWSAMTEIENDNPGQAYDTLRHAWELSYER